MSAVRSTAQWMANPVRGAKPLRDNMLERDVPQVCLIGGRVWTPPPTKALGPIGPKLLGDTGGDPQDKGRRVPSLHPSRLPLAAP
ncbi:MAG: hypothetical protein V3U14_12345, partial [candidate division NC10 bacterium]